MTLRVAILGDTHGVLDPRIAEAVSVCDYAVHTGDVGCAAVLNEMCPRRGLVLGVRGNNDTASKWPDDDAPMLEQLPLEASQAVPRCAGNCLWAQSPMGLRHGGDTVGD